MFYVSDSQQILQEIAQLRAETVQLRAEVVHLREINSQQQQQIDVLIQENYVLREENRVLREENQALRKENQELKEKLNINSSNSSIPPSQDPHRAKSPKTSKGRRPGGQPGHTGHSRKLFPPDQVQKFVNILPKSCPICGEGTLDTNSPISTERRQQIDLPEIKPEVTQYNLHTCQCGKCGKHVAPELPKEARRGFGPRLMGFLVVLAGEAKATRSVIVKLLGHLGIPISSGSVSNIQKLTATLLKTPYEEIKTATLNQAHVNADESSWNNLNKKHWIWVGATKTTVFFKIDTQRSQAAFKRVFVNYKNAMTADRYSAYNVHEGELQTCWAHLDRDFAKIAERDGNDGVIGRLLQEQADAIFKVWRQFANGQYMLEEMRTFIEKDIVPNVKACLKIGASANDVNPKTQSTCLNLLERFQTLWLFLYQEGVEPTNNLAERALRSAVIWRKISFGSKSDWGERFIERVLSVILTFRQIRKNAYAYFTECFQAWQNDTPMPSPLFQ